MKVLLVNKFHHVVGGSETYYFGLGKMLEQLGYQVIYFSMKDERNMPCEQESYFVENVDFNAHMSKLQTLKAGWNMLYSREAKRKFEQLIRDEKPDLIHLNIFQSQLTGSIVDVAYKYHVPMVYTAHELKSICPNYQMLNHGKVCEACIHGKVWNCFKNGCMKDSKAKSLLATLEARVYQIRKTYQKMNLVITPSAFYKKKLEEAGVFPCPIIHMPNFLPEGTDFRVAERCEGDYFLYFGRLGREKGILTLLNAYAQANLQKKLYIAGTGMEKEKIEAFIAEKNLQDKVSLLGFLVGQELKDVVNGAHCICLPSEWYENGPYSIMEAQAVGKPVIVSDQGGLPELVEEGVNGYIVEAGNADNLAEILRKCEEKTDWDAAAISERAKQKFFARSYAENLVGLYEKLL